MIIEYKEAEETWKTISQAVEQARETFLQMEAGKKPLFADLVLKASAKTIKEREYLAFASEEWGIHSDALVISEHEFYKQQLRLEIIKKRIDFLYLELKMNHDREKRPG